MTVVNLSLDCCLHMLRSAYTNVETTHLLAKIYCLQMCKLGDVVVKHCLYTLFT